MGHHHEKGTIQPSSVNSGRTTSSTEGLLVSIVLVKILICTIIMMSIITHLFNVALGAGLVVSSIYHCRHLFFQADQETVADYRETILWQTFKGRMGMDFLQKVIQAPPLAAISRSRNYIWRISQYPLIPYMWAEH